MREEDRMRLHGIEGKLWMIECQVDHRQKNVIKEINELRQSIYIALGWKVTTNQQGLMVAAKKVK